MKLDAFRPTLRRIEGAPQKEIGEGKYCLVEASYGPVSFVALAERGLRGELKMADLGKAYRQDPPREMGLVDAELTGILGLTSHGFGLSNGYSRTHARVERGTQISAAAKRLEIEKPGRDLVIAYYAYEARLGTEGLELNASYAEPGMYARLDQSRAPSAYFNSSPESTGRTDSSISVGGNGVATKLLRQEYRYFSEFAMQLDDAFFGGKTLDIEGSIRSLVLAGRDDRRYKFGDIVFSGTG